MPTVKRGDWVLVEDVTVFEGSVVVVIGVTALIRAPRKESGGHSYRAAEVRRCRPLLADMLARGGRGPEPAPTGPSDSAA